MTRDFDSDQHVDEYQVQLKGILDNAIAAQRSAPELHASNPAERTGDPVVDDLVEALRRSVHDATQPPT